MTERVRLAGKLKAAGASYSMIGRALGVSRQRALAMVKQSKAKPRKLPTHCKACGSELTNVNPKAKTRFFCNPTCGKRYSRRVKD